MKILFAHQRFPAQYAHLARHLAEPPGHEVVFITQRKEVELPGVRKIVYTPRRKPSQQLHHYLHGTEAAILNGQEAARVALQLRQEGFCLT